VRPRTRSGGARWRGGAAAAVVALIAVRLAAAAGPSDRAPDLVVIVNAGNPVAPGAVALEDVFLRKQVEWPDGERIIPLNATADSERRQRFDRAVLGMSADAVARYWLDARIRGGGVAPREVADPALTIKLIARLAGTVGYVPEGVALDGVRVIARIHNDKVEKP
jgi:hypothetical protein